jgi:type VI secretion system secreted protein VgrG
VATAIKEQNDAISGTSASTGKAGEDPKFPELAEPHIVLASPSGLASTTPGSTHQHSGKHHAVTTGGHTSISSSKSLLVSAKESVRLFAYKAGMKLISASSDVNINALKTSIHLLAKMDITLTTNAITLIAKKQVLVNGGGSYMQWSDGAIEEGTAGTRVVHAGTHPMTGPKSQPPVPITWPGVKGDDRFLVHYPDGSPVVGAKYRATLESGEVLTGVTDAQGQTELLKSALIGRYTIDVFPVAA